MQTTRYRFWLWLIRIVGVIVPRRLRADWLEEWEAELRNRETLLAEWGRLDLPHKFDLLRRSLGAFRDALLLQPRRLEDEMIKDLRYGMRTLRAHPGFTAVAVFCLALGLGANTAIFSLVQAALLRSLPVPEPDRLVELSRPFPIEKLSYPDYAFLRDRNDVLSGLAIHTSVVASFGDGPRSEVVVGTMVSGNYFNVLGVKPILGRAFLPEEDRTPGTHPVVIISHNFWQSRFAGDPNLIGRSVVLNSQRFTVIGVMPAWFDDRTVVQSNLWVPVMMFKQVLREPSSPPDDMLNNRQFRIFETIGRLKPGISLVQAQAALEVLNRQIELANPPPAGQPRNPNEATPLSLARPQGTLSGPLREMGETASKLLSVTVITILLIACANIANLLLARASSRRKEIAIRLALGATRLRLIRQLLTESMLLALLGAGIGLATAYWFNQLLMAFKPPFPPPFNFSLDLFLDTRAFIFALLLAAITSMLFGLAPALQASKPDLIPALKDDSGAEGRRQRRFNLRDALVIAQMALSLLLLIGAGLFIRSLFHAQRIDLGFKPDKVLQISFSLNLQGYSEARGKEFYRQMTERLEKLPGVQSASVTNITPRDFFWFNASIQPEGRDLPPDQRPTAGSFTVGRRYLETIGTPLMRGRDFTAQDDAASPHVAIVSESLARILWPELKDTGEALGKSLRVTSGESEQHCEVIGVAKDSSNSQFVSLTGTPPPSIFRPFAQNYRAMASLVVRTSGDPRELIPAVRNEIAAIDQNLAPNNIQPLTENVSLALWPARTAAIVLGIFGLVSLVLAVIGIYGVMSYMVARRTREIGVRMALGAQASDILKLVVRQGLRLALMGTAVGLSLAFALTRLMRSLLYGIGPTDPVTFAGVAVFLIGVALAACYLPARRATRVDPLKALRHE